MVLWLKRVFNYHFLLPPESGAEQVPGSGQVSAYAPFSQHVAVCSAHCWLQSQNLNVIDVVRTNSVVAQHF